MPDKFVAEWMDFEKVDVLKELDSKIIKRCSKHFNVSEMAMNYRLKTLDYKVPYMRGNL